MSKTDKANSGRKKFRRKNPVQNIMQEPPDDVIMYYDERDSSFWMDLNGRFIAPTSGNLTLLLKGKGLSDQVAFKGISQIDWPLYYAMQKRLVDYAGPLAGHRTGITSDGSGRNYLVVNEAKGVWDDCKETKKTFFEVFIEELLPNGQHDFLCHWLAAGLRSMRSQDFGLGQACIFAGVAQCGKSLLQQIITEIFGGRVCNPFEYLMGTEKFNKEVIGAEHWQIEDPPTTTDTRTRSFFGNRLKEATVNSHVRVRAMHKDASYLKIFRRVTISVNDEPHNLAVCPPMDDSLIDKIFLFRCAKVEAAFAPYRLPSGELDRAKLQAAFLAEIPAVRAWLLKNFRRESIPKNLRDDRFQIKAWQHPELMAELSAMSKEIRLLDIIGQAFDDEWKAGEIVDGKAGELETKLNRSNVGDQFKKLISWPNEFASLLGKLHKSHPDRVSKRVSGGYTTWTIHPPTSVTLDSKKEQNT
jgi:hypothetical protein